jgi:hypothetical protein
MWSILLEKQNLMVEKLWNPVMTNACAHNDLELIHFLYSLETGQILLQDVTV